MVAPAVELQAVIDKIAHGSFVPDGPRSAFFRETSQPCPTFGPAVKEEVSHPDDGMRSKPVVPEIVISNVSPSEDDDSDVAVSDEEEFPPDAVPKVKRFRARIPSSEVWFVHKKSKILHKKDVELSEFWGRTYLMCGKMQSDSFEPYTESNALNTLCKVCVRRS